MENFHLPKTGAILTKKKNSTVTSSKNIWLHIFFYIGTWGLNKPLANFKNTHWKAPVTSVVTFDLFTCRQLGVSAMLTASILNVLLAPALTSGFLTFIATTEITAPFLCACGGARQNNMEPAGVIWAWLGFYTPVSHSIHWAGYS